LNRQFLIKLLGYFGHRLLEAADGVEAFSIARAEHPDLIISDLIMPNMDGQELAIELRRHREFDGTPIIFYSATYGMSEVEAMARKVAAFGILSKPSSPQKILEMVNKALALSTHGDAKALVEEEIPEPHTPFLVDSPPAVGSDLEAVSYRLAALVGMSLELTAERQPDRLLRGVAKMARELISSKYSFVALSTPERSTVRYFWSHGKEAAHESANWPLDTLSLEHRIESKRQGALSFVSVPLASPSCSHGWLCLGDKVGGTVFGLQDQGVVSALACQAAAAYEKLEEQSRTDERVKELNATLKSRLEALQLANQSLEDFSYAVTHDLEAPLRVISGFAAILAGEHRAQLDDKGLGLLTGITSTVQKMQQLIRDLVNFTGSDSSGLKKSGMDMCAMAQSVSNELASLEPDRQAEGAVQPLQQACGDPAMLPRVLVH
jgi:CheY-like chemotaxis protein